VDRWGVNIFLQNRARCDIFRIEWIHMLLKSRPSGSIWEIQSIQKKESSYGCIPRHATPHRREVRRKLAYRLAGKRRTGDPRTRAGHKPEFVAEVGIPSNVSTSALSGTKRTILKAGCHSLHRWSARRWCSICPEVKERILFDANPDEFDKFCEHLITVKHAATWLDVERLLLPA